MPTADGWQMVSFQIDDLENYLDIGNDYYPHENNNKRKDYVQNRKFYKLRRLILFSILSQQYLPDKQIIQNMRKPMLPNNSADILFL